MQSNGLKREQISTGNVHLMIQRLNHEIHELIERKNQSGTDAQKVAQLICLRKENFGKLRCTRRHGGK